MKKLMILAMFLFPSIAFAQTVTPPEVSRAAEAHHQAVQALDAEEHAAHRVAVLAGKTLTEEQIKAQHVKRMQLDNCYYKLRVAVATKVHFTEPGCMAFYPTYEMNIPSPTPPLPLGLPTVTIDGVTVRTQSDSDDQ